MKTILVDAWNTFVTEDGIDLELQQLLDSFPNPKIIVTNANEEQKVAFGIVNMPYVVFSLAHEPNKTDPNYFKKLFSTFDLSAKDVVYFEHNKEAVASAISLGIPTYWLNPKIKDIQKLQQFLNKSL